MKSTFPWICSFFDILQNYGIFENFPCLSLNAMGDNKHIAQRRNFIATSLMLYVLESGVKITKYTCGRAQAEVSSDLSISSKWFLLVVIRGKTGNQNLNAKNVSSQIYILPSVWHHS